MLLIMLAMAVGFLLPVFAGGQQAAKEKEVTEAVTINLWMPSEAPTNNQFWQDIVDEFASRNPSINVETIFLSTVAKDLHTKLNTALLSNTYPDLMGMPLIMVGDRGARGEFAELSDYLAEWEGADDILESTIDMGKYKGKLICFGYQPSPVLRLYRKDFFAEAGLDPEKPPTNWQELEATVKKVAVYDANRNLIRAGMDLENRTTSLVGIEPFMRQAGSLVVDEINQKPSFTDRGAIEAFEFLGRLWNSKISFPYFWEDLDNYPFKFGRSAIGNLMPGMITALLDADPSLADKLGYVPVMMREDRKEQWAFCGYRLFGIGNSSKHKDQSWELVKYFMSPDVMWRRYEKLRVPPVRKSLMTEFFAADPEMNRMISEYVEKGKGKPVTPWTDVYNRYVSKAYEEVINQEKTAEQALNEAEAGLLDELKKIK